MKTKRNPTVPRIEYVAKQYPDYVTLATIQAFAEAVGAHQLENRLMTLAMSAQKEPSAQPAVRMLPRWMDEHGVPASSRFDRYLPWVAREINRLYKPYKRIAKKLGLSDFPQDLSLHTLRMLESPDWKKDWPGEWDELTRMLDKTRDLISRFASITNWAEAENIDLNQYHWSDAIEATIAWMAEQRYRADEARVVYTFPDKWTVQELTTKKQLEEEGDAMGHCVGSYRIQESEDKDGTAVILDPYSEVSSFAAVRIFSLRDPRGNSHATLEWSINDDFVKQLRGKQNAKPKREYLDRMVEFRENYLDAELADDHSREARPSLSSNRFDGVKLGAYWPSWAPTEVYVIFQDHELVYPLDVLREEVAHLIGPQSVVQLSHLLGDGESPEQRDFWFMWKHFNGASRMSHPDEMVQWLLEDGVKYQGKLRAASNPSSRRGQKMSVANPLSSLKRKLMR